MPHIFRSLVSLLLLLFSLVSANAAERPDIPWGFPILSPEDRNFMREVLHNSRTIVDYTSQHVLNPNAPVSQDFLNLNDAHQTGSKQAVSFLREMMGLPFETIPDFNDQSPFGGPQQETREEVTEIFEDISSGDDEFMNMLDGAVSGLSMKDPSPQTYLDDLYGLSELSGEALEKETRASVFEALRQQGASTEEIDTVLGSPHISSLIHKSAGFAEQRRGLSVTVTLMGEEDSPSHAPNRVLTSGLRLCTEAANSFNEFAEKHPTLASLSLTAMQVALGGPASYVRNMAMHYTGVQDQVDGIVEIGKAWVSNHLQDQMGMSPDHANLFTQGGGFGLTIGLSTLGGASKDKVLHEAKNVADTAKKMMGEYRHVRGHHVHAKKAFEGHINYDARKGFSISEKYMAQMGIDHRRVTSAQQKMFVELGRSGKENTMKEHSKIAVNALIKGGATKEEARNLVAQSLRDLKNQGVTIPNNIPWFKG